MSGQTRILATLECGPHAAAELAKRLRGALRTLQHEQADALSRAIAHADGPP